MRRGREVGRVLVTGAAVGAAGAVSAAAVEVATLGVESPAARALARLLAGAALASGAAWVGAPAAVASGALAGPVLVTGLDLVARLVPSRPAVLPPVGSGGLGAPWAPSPAWAGVTPVARPAR